MSHRIAISINHVFAGQAEGYFAISALAIIAIATLACVAIYLLRRFPPASAKALQTVTQNDTPDRGEQNQLEREAVHPFEFI